MSEQTTRPEEPEQITIEPLRNEDGSVEWHWHMFGAQECIATGVAINLLECVRSLTDYVESETGDEQ